MKCGSYKDKLAEFVGNFDEHKQELRDLLQSQGARKLIDIQVDIRKVVAYVETKSAKEKQAEEYVHSHGGLDAILKASGVYS